MATEAEQSSENGMYTHEDVHSTKKNYIQTNQEDNNLQVLEQGPFLEILCGMASGKNKFRAGVRTKPVKVNDSWYSLASRGSVCYWKKQN